MIEDENLKTKIQIESRIATRIIHIYNILDLIDLGEKTDTEYIRNELKAISNLVTRGIFEVKQ